MPSAHPLLLELNTRCWLRSRSQQKDRHLTLAGIPAAEFKRWRELGFTHIWLMGVWPTGPRARAQALASPALRRAYDEALPGWTDDDVPGSPYAVADYRVAAELGGEKALASFRQKLHAAGLKLILDFVPNHLGLDHPWVTAHPERFVQADHAEDASMIGGSAKYPVRVCHGRDPFFDPWMDTVQLDYRRTDTREAMRDELQRVASRCDGVRCDMAMLLLNDVFRSTWSGQAVRGHEATGEFWTDTIAAVRAEHPEFCFIAEAYWEREEELLRQGFDFAYNKPLTDALCTRPAEVVAVVQKAHSWLAKGVHFLENHDEKRAAAQLAAEAHRTAITALLCLPGMRFLYDGQIEGAKIHAPVQLGRQPEEPADAGTSELYLRLLALLPTTAIGNGHVQALEARAAWSGNDTASWMLLIQWQPHTAAEPFQLVVVNFAPHRSQCYAPLNVDHLATRNWLLVDLLGTERHERNGEEMRSNGLYLDVPPHATQIFSFTDTA